ncbi:dehydrogenase [Streptomyces sp. NPDC002619]|uniref:dehydrogenase n=1 Tax=Streptomyces sp. NPDC002619 TaxID=3364655 RepID=UPI003699DB1C
MTVREAGPGCPECAAQTVYGGLVLVRRDEDGLRVCRSLWRCPAPHVSWRWADRPDDPLEPCPYPRLLGG